jgi:hypothetical protein
MRGLNIIEYYRTFTQDAEDNKESSAMGKLTIQALSFQVIFIQL